MNKELIDRAWACLPREFKEKVKKEYARCVKIDADDNPNLPAYAVKSAISRRALLEKLFGEHNLTSDSEGEEMLIVSRKRVQEFYTTCKEVTMNPKSYPDYTHESALSRMALLDTLFGSKCLPDVPISEPIDCDNPLADKDGCRWRNDGKCTFDNACYFEPLNPQEPKSAEPKFKVGDTASYVCSPTLKHKCTVTKVMQNEHSGKYEYNVMFEWGKPGLYIPESDLEPYTEPTANYIHSEGDLNTAVLTDKCSSASTCDKQFDNILTDSFRDHNRLHIAAMMVLSVIATVPCSENEKGYAKMVATRARILADALISECKKGGGNA